MYKVHSRMNNKKDTSYTLNVVIFKLTLVLHLMLPTVVKSEMPYINMYILVLNLNLCLRVWLILLAWIGGIFQKKYFSLNRVLF